MSLIVREGLPATLGADRGRNPHKRKGIPVGSTLYMPGLLRGLLPREEDFLAETNGKGIVHLTTRFCISFVKAGSEPVSIGSGMDR
jgi:hypothetical protein